MREIDDETLKKLVEFSKGYFENIDESFFSGLADILSGVGERMGKVDVDTSAKDSSAQIPPDLDLKIFDIVEQFYRTLSPTLGDMARNQLSHTHVYMTEDNLSEADVQFQEEQGTKAKNLTDADYGNIPLEKSWDAVLVAAHEVAHRFTLQDSRSIMPENQYDDFGGTYTFEQDDWKNPSLITQYILGETVSIYAELLCAEFIKENYGIDPTEILTQRYTSISTYAQKEGNTEIEYLRALKDYVTLLKSEELDETSKLKYKDAINVLNKISEEYLNTEREGTINFHEGQNLLEFGYGIIKPHRVGFILAAHLYQSNLGNAEKQVETFNNLLKALSIVTEFGELSEEDLENHIDPNTTIGEEEISLIQKAGLPIAKDGKLKISSEAVKAILGAFDKEMLKDRAILKDKTREETKQQKGNITIKESTKAALLSGVTEEDIKKAKEQQSLEQQSLLNKTPDERVGEEEIENE